MAVVKAAVSFDELLQKAQACHLDFTSVLSAELNEIVTANADAVGVPPEFILFPLITATASFLGTSAFVQINSEWKEPSIIWSVMAARKGEKKTAALRRVRKPIEEIEKELRDNWRQEADQDKTIPPPQLIVDHFSFEELHAILSRNNGQVLGAFDEITTFYGQLDLFKHTGSTIDRKTLLSLNSGSSWCRNFRNYTGTIEKTAFNLTGFIQPAFAYQMLNSPDHDGLNDRQLIDFPPERDVFLKDLKVPVPTHIPCLKTLFQIVKENTTRMGETIYSLDGEAYEEFAKVHDDLVRMKMRAKDENAQGILSKSRGYAARVAMVLHVLEQAVEIAAAGEGTPPQWTTSISKRAVTSAATIVGHCNAQKFIMLGFDKEGVDPCTCGPTMNLRLIRLLSAESPRGDGVFKASDIAQKHISLKVGSSYPTSKAVELMEEAEQLGFGSIETITTPNNRSARRFKKRPIADLSPESQELLKKAKLTSSKYSMAFIRPPLHPLQDNMEEN